jgi:uncharacterized protein (TIGR04255 family)
MTQDLIPKPHELANKPLVEAIFELRWALESGELPGIQRDRGFRILFGRYYERVRKEYPEVVDLPSSVIPEELSAYVVRHQFWTAKGVWPVTQIGPGVMTVNETAGYTWEGFRPRVMKAVEYLFASYPLDIADLRPVRAELQYIDALAFDPKQEDFFAYLEESLHTRISIDGNLFHDSVESKKPIGFNLRLAFPLSNPKGIGVFSFSEGTRDDKPAVIWNTIVRSFEEHTPCQPEEIEKWLGAAHEITDKWFFTLARGKLMSIFEGDHA